MSDSKAYAGSEDDWAKIVYTLRRGDIVGVVGSPGKSKRGELSIFPRTLVLLSPCMHMLPREIKNVEVRFRQRYMRARAQGGGVSCARVPRRRANTPLEPARSRRKSRPRTGAAWLTGGGRLLTSSDWLCPCGADSVAALPAVHQVPRPDAPPGQAPHLRGPRAGHQLRPPLPRREELP